MSEEIKERTLNRKLKNFTYTTKTKENQDGKEVDYDQFLCTFKESISGEDYDCFCKSILYAKHLPSKLAEFFLNLEQAEVVNFSEFFNIIERERTINNIELALVLNKFFDMLDFGDYRNKSDNHIGYNVYFAQIGMFGNVKKDRRLLEEYQSAAANEKIISMVGSDVIYRNYVGSVKQEKPAKAPTLTK